MAQGRGPGGALLAAGIAATFALATYAIFSVAGEPWGSLNDVANAGFGVLAGAFAWGMRSRIGRNVAGLAEVGAILTVFGSALILTQTTGWFFAGLVSTTGFGLIGPSVTAIATSYTREGGLLAFVGRAAGWVLMVGVVGVAAVVMGYDDPTTAPSWVWLPFTAWLGVFVLYPIWAVGLGSRLRARRGA